MKINWCNFGFHKWKYTFEGTGRWCSMCPEKQEQVWGLGVDGEWVSIRPTPLAPDRAKRAAKSKPSASKRSKSGAAGKA